MKYLPLVLLLALCTMLAFSMTREQKTQPQSPLIGKALPEVVIAGESLNAIASGQVRIINFFASWCLPCAVEHPALMQLQAKNIAPILGVAWKNKAEDVEGWLNKRGNPYTHLLLDVKGEATLPLALTGVPETFIIDKNNVIAYHTSQPITEETISKEIIPLVERLQAQ